jgi:hypothetical protein
MPDITDEQLKAFQDAEAKATALETAKIEVEKKLQGYESDATMMNWRKMRESADRMKEALKATGKNFDDEGNIVDSPTALSADEIRKVAREEAQREAVDTTIARARGTLNEADKVIFDKFYAKAAHGETVDMGTVDSIIDSAMKMATANGGMTAGDRTAATRGGAPRMSEGEGTNFADTAQGKELAARLGLKV